jgi:hypothetical protein
MDTAENLSFTAWHSMLLDCPRFHFRAAGKGVRSKMEFVMWYEIQTTLIYDPLPIGYRNMPLEICVVNRITKPNDKLQA